MLRVAPGFTRFLAGGALAMALASAGSAWAGVSISPVVVEIDSPRRPASVTVRNTGSKPITLQANPLSWRQPDGADRYEASSEIMVVPAIATIAPGASQVFRVAVRAPASPTERAYRLVLEDVTQELAAGDAQVKTVAVRFNHNLPVLVAPSRPVQRVVQWKPCGGTSALSAVAAASDTRISGAAGSYACVTMHNAGNRRIRVSALRLSGDGWEQRVQLPAPDVLLAGGQRSWRIPLRGTPAADVRRVGVESEAGLLEASSAGF